MNEVMDYNLNVTINCIEKEREERITTCGDFNALISF